jgi:hypothetical protein
MPIDSVTLRLRADRLTVAAHGDAWVEFTNTMALPGGPRLIQGNLQHVRVNGVGTVELIVDGRYYALRRQALVNITTAELS